MAKRKNNSPEAFAIVDLEKMKHKDLQRACVVRGLDFESVVSFSDPKLAGFFTTNYFVAQRNELLDLYDAWKDEKVKEYQKKHNEKETGVHPMLRLGYIGDLDPDTGEPIIKRPKGIKKPKKKKRERDTETKLFKGTKKDLTYNLTKEGKDMAEIWKQVSDKFPEAKEKSVKIWYNRAKKELKNQKK